MRLALALGIALFGCGNTNQAIDTGGLPDAARGSNAQRLDAGQPMVDAHITETDGGFICRTQVTSGNTAGHHNPGMDCMDGCHDHGFTLAGTLYTSSTGSTIVSGATISVIDATAKDIELVSQTNGNFYTSEAVTFPITIYASSCPNIQLMTAQVASSSDNGCNRTGCHDSSASPGRIHLP